jgi:hypothetical protein
LAVDSVGGGDRGRRVRVRRGAGGENVDWVCLEDSKLVVVSIMRGLRIERESNRGRVRDGWTNWMVGVWVDVVSALKTVASRRRGSLAPRVGEDAGLDRLSECDATGGAKSRLRRCGKFLFVLCDN